MDPLLLKIAACLLFGIAATLLSLVAYRLLGAAKTGTYTGTSARRAEMRAVAERKSLLFRLAVPWLQMLGRFVDAANLESLRNYVRAPYAKAGYPGGLDDSEVVGLGILLSLAITLFIGFATLVLLGPAFLWLSLFGLPIGFLLLASSLKTRAQVREVDILRALPYLIDLLVLMLRSGSSLRIALARAVEDYSGHPIGVEFGQVLAEIDMGASRGDAFRKLAARLNIQDINALVDSLVQAEELGWPLAETLERLADRLAAERILNAQATAGAAGVMVMIPSTMVLASAVLLLFAPFIVRMMRQGGTGL